MAMNNTRAISSSISFLTSTDISCVGDSELCANLWPKSRAERSPRWKHDWRARLLPKKPLSPETLEIVLSVSSGAMEQGGGAFTLLLARDLNHSCEVILKQGLK